MNHPLQNKLHSPMDNYSILLDEFHDRAGELTSNQEFIKIISELKHAKQFKRVIIARKKSDIAKILKQSYREKYQQQKRQIKQSFLNTLNFFEDGKTLSQTNNTALRVELEQMQKQLQKIKIKINQLDSQISLFSNKQNQLQQLKTQSKRHLETIEMQIKYQKTTNQEQEQRNDKIIKKLNKKKQEILNGNQMLAQQIDIKDQNKDINGNENISFSRFMKAAYITQCQFSDLEIEKSLELCKENKVKKIQQQLRVLYILRTVSDSWFNQKTHKSFALIKSQSQSQLQPCQQLNTLPSTQISEYYLHKLNLPDFSQIPPPIISLFHSLQTNTLQSQNTTNILNSKLKDLQHQYEQLAKLASTLKATNDKNSAEYLTKMEKQNTFMKNQIKNKCRSVFQIIELLYQLSDKFKRVKNTLNNLIGLKNSQENDGQILGNIQQSKKILGLTNTEKKDYQILSKKSSIVSSQRCSISVYDQKPKTRKSSMLSLLNKLPTLNKKQSQQNSRKVKTSAQQADPTKKPPNILSLSSYEYLMYRNPKQLVISWHSTVPNSSDGINLLETILQNDLYRIFWEPSDYIYELDELSNENNCQIKVWQQVIKFLKSLKLYLTEYIQSTLKQINKINTKQPTTNLLLQHRYIIESKQPTGRNAPLLIDKTEISEQTNQEFCDGADSELDLRYLFRKQINMNKNGQLRGLENRVPRKTMPNITNYLSVHREKMGKAHRKIRDLLKNAEGLRIRKKTSPQLCNFNKTNI